MSERFTLISGRTREQGAGLHKGKMSPEYRRAVERVEMNPDDMARLCVEEGDAVRLSTAAGEVEMPVFAGDVPKGVLFVPMGTPVNTVVDGDTSGTGMPFFKGVGVTVEPA